MGGGGTLSSVANIVTAGATAYGAYTSYRGAEEATERQEDIVRGSTAYDRDIVNMLKGLITGEDPYGMLEGERLAYDADYRDELRNLETEAGRARQSILNNIPPGGARTRALMEVDLSKQDAVAGLGQKYKQQRRRYRQAVKTDALSMLSGRGAPGAAEAAFQASQAETQQQALGDILSLAAKRYLPERTADQPYINIYQGAGSYPTTQRKDLVGGLWDREGEY